MSKLTLHSINAFHTEKKIAMIGLSSKGDQFSNMLYKDMKGNDYEIYPVNPKMKEYKGNKVYATVQEIPENIKNALIVTPKSQSLTIVNECIEKGIKNIWIQQGANVKEIKEMDLPEDVNLIYNECFYMYMEPVKGAHAFHRFFKRLFGAYPK